MLVGDSYDVTGSGALVTLEKPAVLNLRYDGALVTSSLAPVREADAFSCSSTPTAPADLRSSRIA